VRIDVWEVGLAAAERLGLINYDVDSKPILTDMGLVMAAKMGRLKWRGRRAA
jgi:hypothetical protein